MYPALLAASKVLPGLGLPVQLVLAAGQVPALNLVLAQAVLGLDLDAAVHLGLAPSVRLA